MYKKVISGVLAVTLTFGAAASTISENGINLNNLIKANAASYDYDEEQAEQDGFKFDYIGESGTIAITGFTQSGTATVPSEIKVDVGGNQTVTYPVTEIKSFGGNTNLKSVVIPGSVKKIDDNAFKGCTNLSSITFESEGLTYIGDNAFEGCFKNERTSGTMVIPETVTDIGEKAFYDCTYLTAVNIPGKVKEMGESAFEGCTKLETVTIEKGASHFSKNTFKGCKYLKSINMENSDIQDVPESFFDGCKLLEDIQLPDTVKTIKKRAFADCGFRKLDNLPESLIEIDEEAYNGCSYLSEVTIPANVETIMDKAFFNCNSLKEVTIPYTVKNLSNKGKAFGWSDEGTTEGFKIAGCDQGNSAAFNYAKDNHFDFEISHNYTWTTKTEATCISEGEEIGTCSCGATSSKRVPASGHKYSKEWTIDKAATTTSTGLKSHHCTVCGDKTSITVIPKKSSSSSAKKVSLSKAKISKISTKTYTGKQIKPSVKVVVGKTTLKKNADYTVSYGTNKIGKASVTIKGKGKYTGTIKKYFYINPRKTTASVTSPDLGKISVKVATKKEASKYQISLSINNKFKNAQTVTMKANKMNFIVTSGKKYYVRVRTITSIGSKVYYSGWSSVKAIKTK